MNKLHSYLMIITLLILGCSSPNSSDSQQKNDNKTSDIQNTYLVSLLSDLDAEYQNLEQKVIQPAEGYLKYPYLIPSGFYKQMWDWDGFFIANYLISRGKPEYLKYWALNLIEGIDEEGYVAGCATTTGPRAIFGKFAMKPFLSQGVYLASKAMDDFSWIEPYYDDLMKVLEYRDKTQLDSTYNLYFWDNAMQSGADNNPAMNYFYKEDKRSFLAPDASTWQMREVLAQALIAEKLGKTEDMVLLRDKAAMIKLAINKYLWCDEDKVYYTVDRETGDFYRRVSFSSFIPLVQGIASQENGQEMINRYLVNPDQMKAEYGFRSLSKKDPDYNNKNIIVPFSNWQGPVWPIANYIYHIGLHNYGFDEEVAWLAETLGTLLLNDIKACGSMHENYHADNGTPLAPAADYVDSEGKFVGFIGWNLCTLNVLEGVVENKWNTLEIK